jgi:hypothetical protein
MKNSSDKNSASQCAELFNDADEPATEISDGFRIKRRRLIWLPLLTAAALVPPNLKNVFATARQPDERNKISNDNQSAEVDWEAFVKQGLPVIQTLHQDASARGQDAYLYELAHWAARLNLKTIPRAKLSPFTPVNPAVHFGVGFRGVPFFTVEWWLEPGAVLPPHCHPNASVCTLGIEGEARIRNFETVGLAPEFSSPQKFQVRETHNEVIATGRINSLSAVRDNIHTFQAGKDGARGVDFSSYHGKDIGFSFLNIETRPLNDERKIYEASWRKI